MLSFSITLAGRVAAGLLLLAATCSGLASVFGGTDWIRPTLLDTGLSNESTVCPEKPL
ncbi:hypothetical protein PGTUg99_018463 [Puccinia graminis f. sp. tritici]|uniref:Uncharacterized protein n=1 Tax=Puccinia graminis f. sp. tritici TaxID=56615 RepID=A0A5B0MB27_PUCGR|nr:hypothetical protein PGTUg99_018463 [Puccinia graminis f. sp. tritici]